MSDIKKYQLESFIQSVFTDCKVTVDPEGNIKVDLGVKALPDGTCEGVCKLPSQRSPYEIGQESAKELFRALNWMGAENETIKGFLDQVEEQHRTLQQAFGHLLIRTIVMFAEKKEKGFYDLRNEALCEMCKELKPIAEKTYLPFI